MNKFNNLTSLIILVVIGGSILVVILLFTLFGNELEIKASLSGNNIEVGDPITYADSTSDATTWYWEFGNNDNSERSSGTYFYTQSGQYRIRLTVNGNREKLFIVNVKEHRQDTHSNIISIIVPQTAIQGELIVFKGVGNDKQWRWEFGASGMVDAREQNPIYAYNEPGVYQIKLQTENTKYPVQQQIEIFPQYSKRDSTDIMSIIGADIREKLQAIANNKPFNSNYNHIIQKYLCSNEKTEVVINNNKYNDIYSYCQGLKMTGKNRKIIEQVVVEISNLETKCVTKIIVIQREK